jgi:hypothetical protein
MKNRRYVLLATLALVVTACSGDEPAATSSTTTTTLAASTTTTTAVPITTTTTTTTVPSGTPIAQQGDDNETVEAIQFALNCTGFGDLTIDGDFGPATLGAANAAQEQLGRAVNDQVDEETFAELSRACSQARGFDGEDAPITLVGNAAAGDPELVDLAVPSKGVLTITIVSATDLTVTLLGPDLTVVLPDEEGGLTWEVGAGEHRIQVEPALDPTTFSMDIDLLSGAELAGAWIMGTNSLSFGDTELALGDDADNVIDFVIETLGHGVRSSYDEFDTGWYVITAPQSLGIRGLFIEGLAFLFFGPHPEDTDRPETLARIRFEGPSDDADGEPRPDNYVTTDRGITVGDSLADLQAAYGSSVSIGGNENRYYRYTDSGGELCFYFVEDAPTDSSLIVEMSTECRP